MTKQEKWKEIAWTVSSRRYEVSDHGNIRSICDKTKTIRYCKVSKIQGHEYLFYDFLIEADQKVSRKVRLKLEEPPKKPTKVRKIRRVYLHRLVWEMFRGELDPNTWIRHKNGDRSNNHIDNLEALPRVSARRLPGGYLHQGNKLTWEDVDEIRRLRRDGDVSMQELARQFSISAGMICRIILGKAWKESTRTESRVHA